MENTASTDLNGSSGWSNIHEDTFMRPSHHETNCHHIFFGDDVFNEHIQIRKSVTEHRHCEFCAFWANRKFGIAGINAFRVNQDVGYVHLTFVPHVMDE